MYGTFCLITLVKKNVSPDHFHFLISKAEGWTRSFVNEGEKKVLILLIF